MSRADEDWDGLPPPVSEPWPIAIITQEPNPQRTQEDRARFIADFNKGVDERNAERGIRPASPIHIPARQS
ncbi:hypothetical protein [Roseomonas chloroacetimidivorans]|uniref:hypothetical protein n=1 Tax=Roseomonas chloroacetimidivorans TaxID=1766656 RepID=UPI003C72DC6A